MPCPYRIKFEGNEANSINDSDKSVKADKHPAKQDKLIKRVQITRQIRKFFDDRGYLEVETPYRIPGNAPEVHIIPEKAEDWFLHTSPELCMKRLLASGYEKIYQICRCFRKMERGKKHLPEFTMLEWYCAHTDYLDMMDETESLIRYVAEAVGCGKSIRYGPNDIDLSPPWQRMTVDEAFNDFASLSLETALEQNRFDEIIALEIEPKLGIKRPVFLYDYPASKGALARLKKADPTKAERFELYIAGLELCNAFSELTDHEEQRRRFEADRMEQKTIHGIKTPVPEKFLDALKCMPEASGNALGVDRLVMLLTNADRIDDITAFTPEEL